MMGGRSYACAVDEPKTLQLYKIGPYDNCTFQTSGACSLIYKYKNCDSRTASMQYGSPCLSYEGVYALKVTVASTEHEPHNTRREARMLRRAAHSNVIPLLDAHGLPDGNFVLKMPCKPHTLENGLASSDRIISLRVLGDLFSALAHIHSCGILHRDIKPSNILCEGFGSQEDGTIYCHMYLADFGTAWHCDDADSEPADNKVRDISTTCYRAPELLFGCKDYSEGVDIWSAGCVAAEVVMHNALVDSPRRGVPWTLFDSGALGSELTLIKSIFSILGTPNEHIWPVS